MKSIIIDNVGFESHAVGMQTRFLNRYSSWTVDIALVGSGTPSGDIVTYQSSLALCIDYAIANGYNLIVRNYSDGFVNRAKYLEAWEAGIPSVVSLGSNSHIILSGNLGLITAPLFVGGGLTTNVRAYGDLLECFDASTTDETEVSWACASFAARFAKAIDDFPLDNLFDTRQPTKAQQQAQHSTAMLAET